MLHLAGEDAPNGRIIQAMRGRFSSNMMYSNKGVDLGTDASINTLEPRIDDVLDMSVATAGSSFQSSND